MINTSSGKVITRVVVLQGGWSHETNFTAHSSVARAYNSFNVEVIPIDIREPRFVELIQNAKPDVVFIANQGAYGEDGKVQGIFDILDIPYVGSGVCASAIGMNKFASKLVFQGLGIKTAKYAHFPFGSLPNYHELVDALGQKLVIKPIMSGGSFGVKITEDKDTFEKQFHLVTSEFADVLVEEFIDGKGKEYACGILEDDIQTTKLPICEISLKTKYFSSESKYGKNLHNKIVPSNLNENQTRRIQDIAYKIHTALGCLGMSRTDMVMTENNEIYVFEINTLPGLLPISIYPKECQAAGISYEKMVEMLTKSAFRRRPMEIKKILTHHSPLSEEIRSETNT